MTEKQVEIFKKFCESRRISTGQAILIAREAFECGLASQTNVGHSLPLEKILPYLEQLQHLLESGETYCFANEFDLATAKDLQALINELRQ
jgi:hypothetical protein